MGNAVCTNTSPWATHEYRIDSPEVLATIKCVRRNLEEEGRYLRRRREHDHDRDRDRDREREERRCRRQHVDELPRRTSSSSFSNVWIFGGAAMVMADF